MVKKKDEEFDDYGQYVGGFYKARKTQYRYCPACRLKVTKGHSLQGFGHGEVLLR